MGDMFGRQTPFESLHRWMLGSTMTIDTLHDFFEAELRDVYAAEHMVLDALDDFDETTQDEKITQAFRDHRNQTKGQIDRLERVFEALGKSPKRTTCEGVQGLLVERERIVDTISRPEIVDLINLMAADKTEHYEISAYGNLALLAKQLEMDEVGDLLHDTLEEEKAMLQRLKNLTDGYDHKSIP